MRGGASRKLLIYAHAVASDNGIGTRHHVGLTEVRAGLPAASGAGRPACLPCARVSATAQVEAFELAVRGGARSQRLPVGARRLAVHHRQGCGRDGTATEQVSGRVRRRVPTG